MHVWMSRESYGQPGSASGDTRRLLSDLDPLIFVHESRRRILSTTLDVVIQASAGWRFAREYLAVRLQPDHSFVVEPARTRWSPNT